TACSTSSSTWRSGCAGRCCCSAWPATSSSSAARAGGAGAATATRCAARHASWGGGRRTATSIFLDPLTPTETRDLIASLLPADAGMPELVPKVAERAGGSPFFAEEMVRRLVEEGTSDATALPDTVQAL